MTPSQDTTAVDAAPRPWKKVRRVARFLVLGLGVGYGLLALGAALFSERLIFQPHPSSYDSPPWLRKAQVDEESYLALMYLPNPKAKWTVLYSHGNAQDLGDVKGYLEIMRDHGFAVLSYDYSGYGKSSGTPSVDAARQDAERAFDYLVDDLGVQPKRVILWGYSLGGAMALHLASRREAAGLVLESTFVTAFRVATGIPILPFDSFRNIDEVKNVRCPVLVLHGEADRLIPAWHGKRLFEAASEPRRCLWVEGAGHNDLFLVGGAAYWSAVSSFVDSLRQSSPADGG